MLIETDLTRHMADLDRSKFDVFAERDKKMALLRKLETIKRTNLVMAQDQVKIEKDRIFIDVCEERGADGKAKYGNDTLRSAAATARQAEDADYKEAVHVLRTVESEIANLQLDVQEIEDLISSIKDLNWTLRTLVDGARSEVMAIATFDGPKVPAEIVHKIPSEIRLTAPESLPQIRLTAPETLPTVTLITPKEAA